MFYVTDKDEQIRGKYRDTDRDFPDDFEKHPVESAEELSDVTVDDWWDDV